VILGRDDAFEESKGEPNIAHPPDPLCPNIEVHHEPARQSQERPDARFAFCQIDRAEVFGEMSPLDDVQAGQLNVEGVLGTE
jgi:hypothetical protein